MPRVMTMSGWQDRPYTGRSAPVGGTAQPSGGPAGAIFGGGSAGISSAPAQNPFAQFGAPGGSGVPAAPPPPAPMQQQLNIPPQQQFSPYQAQPINYQAPGAGVLGERLGQMGEFATGMLDPESDYFKRLMAGLQQQIGGQSQAQQRAAALRAAYGGMGGGRGGEMMQTQADIARSGLRATGAAGAQLRLAAPQMGMQALQSTFAPQLGVQQLTEQARQFGAGLTQQQQQMAEASRQFGAGLGEQGRQFGVGAGLQAQQMAQNAAQRQWEMQQQQYMAQQAQQAQMMQMMAGMF
jgi:hypothetical protein